MIGRRMEDGREAAEVEGVLAAIAERALLKGPRAALEVLPWEALRLTGAAGIALYEGGVRISEAGLHSPPPALARAPQALQVRHGRAVLVVVPERTGLSKREVLARFVRLGGSLLSARRREAAAQARQARLCRELREAERALAHRERNRSRASHDLRTPLLVMKGYVDMMRKGMTGELTPAMERYLERMMSATQDMGTLIAQRLAAGGAPEDLKALLSQALAQQARPRSIALRLECAAATAPLKGASSLLNLLARTLARGLGATGAAEVEGTLEARETTKMWRLRLRAATERPLAAKTRQRLEGLVQRLGGTLAVQDAPGLELTLQLPAA